MQAADESGPSPPSSALRVYELSSASDRFWKANAGRSFPSVAAAVNEKMQQLQDEQARISRSAAASASLESGGTSELSSAISALPRLQRRKRLVETHTNIATALLKAIKRREIDAFCEAEQHWMSRAAADRAELERLIAAGRGSLRDRLRAALIWCLATGASEADVAAITQLLEQQIAAPAAEQKEGQQPQQTAATASSLADLHALDYLRQYRFLHHLQSAQGGQSSASSSSSSSSSASSSSLLKAEEASEGWGLFGKLANSVAKEVVSQTAGVRAGLRNLLPTNTDLPITRLLEAVVLGQSGAGGGSGGAMLDPDRYRTLDPKRQSTDSQPRTAERSRRPQSLTSTAVRAAAVPAVRCRLGPVVVLGRSSGRQPQSLAPCLPRRHRVRDRRRLLC